MSLAKRTRHPYALFALPLAAMLALGMLTFAVSADHHEGSMGGAVEGGADAAVDAAEDTLGNPDDPMQGAPDAAPPADPAMTDEGAPAGTPDVSAAPPADGAAGGGGTYTVQQGDTLSKISQSHYGRMDAANEIFEANRDVLQDPDVIEIGQVLSLP